MYPKWVDNVYFQAEGAEFGRVVQGPDFHGQTVFAWSTQDGEHGETEGQAAARRSVELAYLRKYHPEQFHSDHDVQAGDAGTGGEK